MHLSVCPMQVRIFPYLIGRESAFADNLKWMACANKGVCVHVCVCAPTSLSHDSS